MNGIWAHMSYITVANWKKSNIERIWKINVKKILTLLMQVHGANYGGKIPVKPCIITVFIDPFSRVIWVHARFMIDDVPQNWNCICAISCDRKPVSLNDVSVIPIHLNKESLEQQISNLSQPPGGMWYTRLKSYCTPKTTGNIWTRPCWRCIGTVIVSTPFLVYLSIMRVAVSTMGNDISLGLFNISELNTREKDDNNWKYLNPAKFSTLSMAAWTTLKNYKWWRVREECRYNYSQQLGDLVLSLLL